MSQTNLVLIITKIIVNMYLSWGALRDAMVARVETGPLPCIDVDIKLGSGLYRIISNIVGMYEQNCSYGKHGIKIRRSKKMVKWWHQIMRLINNNFFVSPFNFWMISFCWWLILLWFRSMHYFVKRQCLLTVRGLKRGSVDPVIEKKYNQQECAI